MLLGTLATLVLGKEHIPVALLAAVLAGIFYYELVVEKQKKEEAEEMFVTKKGFMRGDKTVMYFTNLGRVKE